MKFLAALLLTLTFLLTHAGWAAEESPADTKLRTDIPLGGNLKPNPKVPTFVVVGHGARILVSKDDGKTWQQTFFSAPGADHGPWATKTVTYDDGVFFVAAGWGGPTIYLASNDAIKWQHLTHGNAKLPESKGDPRVMPGTWGLAAGKGALVAAGYMTMTTTANLGETFDTFSMWGAFKDDTRGFKLVTHHVDPVFVSEASGRFLALGTNRGKDGPKFGHLFSSDDLGKTWQWLAPKGLDASTGRGTLLCNGHLLVMTDADSANTWTSSDGGETWDGPHPTGTKRAVLSVVRGDFWLCGKPSRSSSDGKTWTDLPAAVSPGQVIASDTGTLISIAPQRFNILRSTDGGKSWNEVHTYTPPDIKGGAQGLRDGAFGLVSP
ncbi:exo-alpha-sialidase [Phragmitibacter flavus]|uniref:Exo-alpha-sialidase n=1 Tax=Phragmitibacter flavus TaxID=2576071 RepID=A0A5R8KDJ0_9BACT|nr:sialidase family protein [Phragmitibacter flavus]TLD70373.1 exo-alpha-sialidase [Phragmitibacter flavus]